MHPSNTAKALKGLSRLKRATRTRGLRRDFIGCQCRASKQAPTPFLLQASCGANQNQAPSGRFSLDDGSFYYEKGIEINALQQFGMTTTGRNKMDQNTRCMVFRDNFSCQIVKKLEFTHFFAV